VRGDLIPAQLRHTDIEQCNLRTKRLGEVEGCAAIMSDANLMASHLQQHREAFGGVLIVVRN